MTRTPRTLGVEEELLLLAEDGSPAPRAQEVLDSASDDDGPLENEFMEEQLETATPPTSSLTELADALRAGRRGAQEAAARHGARVAAVATSPVTFTGTTVSRLRYLRARSEFGLTAWEQLTNGCHVHVGVSSDEEGVAVMDRIGPWLAPLIALSANSPFWQGRLSGYASFRSQVWARWPTAGPVRQLGSPQAYHDAVDALVATGVALDEAMVYFDARLSARYPTVELRVSDVCLDPDSATLAGALARGLVETAAREWESGEPLREVPVELRRTASWRAGRSGLDDVLLDPMTWKPAPAHDVIGAVVDHARDALVDAGDLDTVTDLLGVLWSRGNGATRQRTWAIEADGDLNAVALRAADALL